MNGFGGPYWSRYVDMVYEEERKHDLGAALLVLGAGATDLTRRDSKLPGILVKFLRDSQR